MKKLLFAFLFFSQTCFAEYYTVIKSSVSDSAVCQYGSLQWVDLQMMPSSFPTDSISIYIQHDSSDVSSAPLKLYSIQRYDFLDLRLNSDSVSRKVYFNLPLEFHSGKFKISTLHTGAAYSYFPETVIDTTVIIDTTIATGIVNVSFERKVVSVVYYSMIGEVVNADKPGIYIQLKTYSDKSLQVKRIYIL